MNPRLSGAALSVVRLAWRSNLAPYSRPSFWAGTHLAWRAVSVNPCTRYYVTTPTPKHRISRYDQFVLRVTRTIRSEEMPSEVSIDLMDKANSRFRIMMMMFMMGFCIVGSVYAISQGKKNAAAHIKSVHQQNTERYARLKDKEK